MDTKPWWQSKTIWGAIIATLATVLKLFKVNVELPPDLADQILSAVTLVGTIIAIVGRARASTVISSTSPLDPRSPLMKLLIVATLFGCSVTLPGCAQGPVYPSSPLAVVGSDFTADASAALEAYADYKAGNVSLTWALQEMFNAYALSAQTSGDVKSLLAAWTGNTGDSQALRDRLARVFGNSTAPPAQKMAALAAITQSVAQNKGA